MCEPPIKEDVFAGFAGEMENVKTEGEEDGGWMLSAYCGTDVLKKEFFYTLDRNSVSKPPERYNTVEQQSVFVSGSTQTPASSTLENKSLGTLTDSSGPDSNRGAQPSAAMRPLTIRKRTASYAFVSSEPESNNNKSQYDDAYGAVEAPKLPRISSAETNEETAPQDNATYEDKDYIYENPYLIEYRDYNEETETHEQNHEEELFNFNQQQQGQDEQFVQDMEFRSKELIRQRNCSDLSNQDTLIVIKEMKKTADFTMGEYNALATDLNRDVNEYSRGGRRKSPAHVEWWRITRHLELTCEYVILKLRNELRVDPRTNTRIKTFSSRGGGNINQTLLSMSMSGGVGSGPLARRNSDTLTKQQLTCLNELKDLVKRVLHPKHCKKVKIGGIVSLFYTIKQKFPLDHYEKEIIDYGIETMRFAMKKNQQADSPEVVRCVQEVCDLVKQMVMVRNSFSSAPVIHTPHRHTHVPSLLDIQVTPPIKSRLFNRKLGEAMKLTLNCLMKLYKSVDCNSDDSNIEPKPSTSSASDDDLVPHSAEPFSLDLHDHTTAFPSASDSSSPSAEDLPVINTFSLGSTYDYSKENEIKTEAINEDEEEDKDNVTRGSSPDNSVDRSQTTANDSTSSPQISDPVSCTHHSSEDGAMPQQDVSDSDNIVPNVKEFSSSSAVQSEKAAASPETACSEKDAIVTEETETAGDDKTSTAAESKAESVAEHEDNVAEEKTTIVAQTETSNVDDETSTAVESKAESVAEHKDNVAEEKTTIAAQTATSDADDNSIAGTKIKVENVVENEGNHAVENRAPAACQSGDKSANVSNQYGDYQGCPAVETDSIETILEKTFPIDQDYVADVDLSRDNGDVGSRQKNGTSHNGEETEESFAVQNEMALDLSMHKDDSNQDNEEKN